MRKTILMAFLLAGTALATLPAQADFTAGGIDWVNNAIDSPLSVDPTVPVGNQPTQHPCIMCATNQPHQDAFGYNNFKQGGNLDTFSAFSTATINGSLADNTVGVAYSAGFLRDFLISQLDFNGVLNVGIDLNTAGHTDDKAEVLVRFAILDVGNNTILADTGVINKALTPINNGNGFADYTISGFNIDRSDINADTQIMFFARWVNGSDGGEDFFIVPNVSAVPGPVVGAGPIGLAAASLFGLNFWRRRRNGNALPA